MERIREVILKMIQLSDDGRKEPVTEAEMILRDRIREVIGVYSNGKKRVGAICGK